MSHHDRDAEIAAFIRTKGVTRCPTACMVPTQGSPNCADQAALQQYANARDQCCERRSVIAGELSAFCGFGIEPLCTCNEKSGQRDPQAPRKSFCGAEHTAGGESTG